jgi:hypothetical protein
VQRNIVIAGHNNLRLQQRLKKDASLAELR